MMNSRDARDLLMEYGHDGTEASRIIEGTQEVTLYGENGQPEILLSRQGDEWMTWHQ
jgi:hypothetical protein